MRRLWSGNGRQASWPVPGVVPDTLIPLLEEIGHDFAGYLIANREALAEEDDTVTVELGDEPRQITARPYTERCRVDLADALNNLDPGERARVNELLADVGMADVYALPAAPDVERLTPRDDRR